MKKVFKIKNLDCAVCASKMESLIKKIKGVKDCNIIFMSCRMTLELEDYNEQIMNEVIKAIKKVDSNCEVI